MNSFILVALCVVTCASFAFAQFSADCPPKTGDVYTIGSMDRISYRFNAALLAGNDNIANVLFRSDGEVGIVI